MAEHLLSDSEIRSLIKKDGRTRAKRANIDLQGLSLLLKHMGLFGEAVIRKACGRDIITSFRPAYITSMENTIQSFNSGGALAVTCELQEDLAGVSVVVIDTVGAAHLAGRMVGSAGYGEEILGDEAISAVGELLFSWLSHLYEGIADFLQLDTYLDPQALDVLSARGFEQLPFGWQEPIVEVPVEVSFSNGAVTVIRIWCPVDLAQELTAIFVDSIRSGRKLPDGPGSLKPVEKPAQVYPLKLNDIAGAEGADIGQDVQLLADVSLELLAEIGRADKLIKDILEWEKGTILALDKLAGESADVFINGSAVARGEVLVMDEHLSVRIIEIVDAQERLEEIL